MIERRISRRGFLAVCGFAAAAAAGGWLYVEATDEDFDAELAFTENAAVLFSSLEAARRIGAAYLAHRPSERGERALVRLLEASRPSWREVWDGTGDVSRIARDESRRDYAEGHVVLVEGWYLSLTEARLCALTTFG